jgi:hypothetical protein
MRTPAVRTPAQKAFVLDQMRLFVASIQQISEGLSADDKARVAAAARPRGLIAIRALPNQPPGLSDAETPEWKSLGVATRNGLDAIADAAEKYASAAEILALLATTTKNRVLPRNVPARRGRSRSALGHHKPLIFNVFETALRLAGAIGARLAHDWRTIGD